MAAKKAQRWRGIFMRKLSRNEETKKKKEIAAESVKNWPLRRLSALAAANLGVIIHEIIPALINGVAIFMARMSITSYSNLNQLNQRSSSVIQCEKWLSNAVAEAVSSASNGICGS